MRVMMIIIKVKSSKKEENLILYNKGIDYTTGTTTTAYPTGTN
jgi:hypothetical protein